MSWLRKKTILWLIANHTALAQGFAIGEDRTMKSLFASIIGLFVALGLTFTANAQEKMRLTLDGKVETYFFLTDQDELIGEVLNSTGMAADVEIYFKGKAKTSNGLDLSVMVQLEAEANDQGRSDPFGEGDEFYVDIAGDFGMLRLGQKEGISASLTDETPFAIYEIDELAGRAFAQRNSVTVFNAGSFKQFAEDPLGVSYLSPKLGGFQLGASYFPNTTQQEHVFDQAANDNNAFEVAATWSTRFNFGDAKVAGAYFQSQSAEGGLDGEQAWTVSSALTYGPVDLSANYTQSTPDDGLDQWTVQGGLKITNGRWQYAGHGFYAERDVRDGPQGTPLGEDSTLQLQVETVYTLLPGFELGLVGYFSEQDTFANESFDALGALFAVDVDF